MSDAACALTRVGNEPDLRTLTRRTWEKAPGVSYLSADLLLSGRELLRRSHRIRHGFADPLPLPLLALRVGNTARAPSMSGS
jgi:hypothetical protein